MRPLFKFFAGRDWMRSEGFVMWLQVLPRRDIMGPTYGYPFDEGRETLCWWSCEVRIPWPLVLFRSRSDAAEIRFREGVGRLISEGPE